MAATNIVVERASAQSLSAQRGLWKVLVTLDSVGASAVAHTANMPQKFRKAEVISVHVPSAGTAAIASGARFNSDFSQVTLVTSGGPSTPDTNVVAVVLIEAQN